jgi:4-amino-4-deoxy-L-arabinose transferase-like glycosyltransferase
MEGAEIAQPVPPAPGARRASWIVPVFFLFALLLLLYNLGGPALFEPDEGRNAEIAREILLLGDWTTPHYNFTPRLEKPMFFYALTALSYQLFGVSEWTARLPSALSGFAVIVAIFFFVRSRLGQWPALWSGFVLATCIAHYAFSRIVKLDMTLSLFIVLALCAFYRASVEEDGRRKRTAYLLMYAAAGVATLVKGPIGFVLPGMIVFLYILLKNRWSLLREMELPWGILLFIAIVAPWYVWAEIRNPGYLSYFLGQENFTRFFTPHFRRDKGWYFFSAVALAGFLPWSFLLPAIVKRLKQYRFDDLSLYLILWAVVPVVFYSFSSSKLAEYILPVFPALAILAGKTVAELLQYSTRRDLWHLSLPWIAQNLLVVYFAAGAIRPGLLPRPMREALLPSPGTAWALAGVVLVLLLVSAFAVRFIRTQQPGKVLAVTALLFFFSFGFINRFIEPLSEMRSYRELAEEAARLIRPGDRLVVYDTFLASLPFYLLVREPIWHVWSGEKSNVMGSVYVAEKQPPPAAGYGKVLVTFEEFFKEWKGSDRRLLVFIKQKNLKQLGPATVLEQVDDIAVAVNR